MIIVSHKDLTLHKTSKLPEKPDRIRVILEKLQHLPYVEGVAATDEQIQKVHALSYLEEFSKKCANLTTETITFKNQDVEICKNSYLAALLSAGCAIKAVDLVLQGLAKTTFVACRPPGHHATATEAMGFCLLNNAVIAARHAQTFKDIKNVAIVDFDVHHGNGTQELCEKDPTLFYFSTHEKDIYPGTGLSSEIGVGNIRNIPFSGGKSSRKAILDAYKVTLPQSMSSFKPDLIIISAGFDGRQGDGLASCELTAEDFTTITENIVQEAKKHCKGRIVSLLEGGYNLKLLAESVSCHVKALLT